MRLIKRLNRTMFRLGVTCLVAVVGFTLLTCLVLPTNCLAGGIVCQEETDSNTDQELKDQKPRKRLVQNPYDFSEAPAIPDVDVPSSMDVQQSIDRGVEFLLGCQRETGAWGAATNTKDLNIYAPIPGAHDGFRMATTSLCITALLETDYDNDERVQQCVDRAEAWLMEQLPSLKRATSDAIYNCWAHTYSIDALLALRRREGVSDEKRARLDQLIQSQLKMLDTYESVDGGWGYYDFRYGGRKPTSSSTSFLNGASLIVLHNARQAGFDVNEKTVKRARCGNDPSTETRPDLLVW